MFKAIRATGYELSIRVDALDIIDLTALKQHLTQQQDAVWDGLDVCPRTLPLTKGQVLHVFQVVCQGLLTSMQRSLLNTPVSARLYEGPAKVLYGLSSLAKRCRVMGQAASP